MNDRELAVVEAVRLTTFTTLVNEGVMVPTRQGIVHGSFDVNCCVAASRLAMEVLKEFYVFSRAMKVQVAAFNSIARDWGVHYFKTADAAATVNPDDPPPGSAIRYCGFSGKDDPGMVDGHVVLVVEKEVLLDPTAPQFSLAKRQLLIEPLIADLRSEWGRQWLSDPTQWLSVELDEGAIINYRQHRDLGNVFDAPDWRAHDQDMQVFKEVIVKKVRGML